MQENLPVEQIPNPFSTLVAYWKWLLLAGVVGGVCGAIYTLVITPVYRTRAEIIVSPSASDTPIGFSPLIITGNNSTPITILDGIFSSEVVRDRLAEAIKKPRHEFDKQYVVRTDATTNVIALTFDSFDPKEAKAILKKSVELTRESESNIASNAAGIRYKQLGIRLKQKQTELDKEQETFAKILSSSSDLGAVTAAEFTNAKEKAEQASVEYLQAKSLYEIEKSSSLKLKERFQVPTTKELQDLQKQLSDAQSDFKSASEIYGPDAPQLAAAKDNLEIAKSMYQNKLEAEISIERKSLTDEISNLSTKVELAEANLKYWQQIVAEAPADIAALELRNKRIRSYTEATSELSMQFELAKIDANMGKVRWAVLSEPLTEDQPINRRYIRFPLICAVFAAFLTGCFLYFSKPFPKGKSS